MQDEAYIRGNDLVYDAEQKLQQGTQTTEHSEQEFLPAIKATEAGSD